MWSPETMREDRERHSKRDTKGETPRERHSGRDTQRETPRERHTQSDACEVIKPADVQGDVEKSGSSKTCFIIFQRSL